MPVRPTLLHRMALVSVLLFRKNLGNLREFFGQMVYRPPLAKNCPYAYVEESNIETHDCEFWNFFSIWNQNQMDENHTDRSRRCRWKGTKVFILLAPVEDIRRTCGSLRMRVP